MKMKESPLWRAGECKELLLEELKRKEKKGRKKSLRGRERKYEEGAWGDLRGGA